MAKRWVGIDCGYSHMAVAILDEPATVVAVEHTGQPAGDGHSADVALARLRALLGALSSFRDVPVWLAGYCYEKSGVAEAFEQAGWIVEGTKALNDVVGLYGLTEMSGNAIVCGCGSFPQIVYVGAANAVNWPGEDVSRQMPDWLLSGRAYASFLLDLSGQSTGDLGGLARRVQEVLGTPSPELSGHRWGSLGPLLGPLLGHPGVRAYMARAAAAVAETRAVLRRYVDQAEPPVVIFGGGAVRDDAIWAALSSGLRERHVIGHRVQGEPALGLARFASRNPDADPWGLLGREPPSWMA